MDYGSWFTFSVRNLFNKKVLVPRIKFSTEKHTKVDVTVTLPSQTVTVPRLLTLGLGYTVAGHSVARSVAVEVEVPVEGWTRCPDTSHTTGPSTPSPQPPPRSFPTLYRRSLTP